MCRYVPCAHPSLRTTTELTRSGSTISWIVYIGTHEIHLAEVVSKPDHSIFKFQSKQAGLLLSNWGLKLLNLGGALPRPLPCCPPQLASHAPLDILNHIQRNHALNGDGCGIGALPWGIPT